MSEQDKNRNLDLGELFAIILIISGFLQMMVM